MQAGVFCDIEREKGSRDVVCCRIPKNPILLRPIHVVRFVVLSSTFFYGYKGSKGKGGAHWGPGCLVMFLRELSPFACISPCDAYFYLITCKN